MIAGLHVVFGAGQIGQRLAVHLHAGGHHVRVVRRSSRGGLPDDVEVRAGDAMDPAFCRAAADGATVVYHCLNPPYDTSAWAVQVPRYTENLIAAAGAAGARLVVLENLYMLAPARGRVIDEDSPIGPVSRKGAIRARATERLFDAHHRGEVVAVAGRASDFYGPGGTMSGLGDFFWPDALAGKRVRSPYPLDVPHTWHYIPDVAAGLAVLGNADADACGRAWMLPCQPAEPLQQLVDRLAAVLGRQLRTGGMPRLLVKALGLMMPVMREIDEMLYQWDGPSHVDDRRFRTRFGLLPAPLDLAARETVAWATRHYARA